MENYNNMDGDLETMAVLMGNSQLNPDINYIGFDGEVIDTEFIDLPDEFSNASGRRRKQRRSVRKDQRRTEREGRTNLGKAAGYIPLVAAARGLRRLKKRRSGFDGEPIDLDFIDLPDEFSAAIGKKKRGRKKKKNGGGFNRFLQGIGISPEASQERRDLKKRKQTSSEREQKSNRQSERENIQLQKQAVDAASRDDGSSADLQKIMAAAPVVPVIPPKKMKTGTKIALIGGGVLLLAGITYAVIKYSKK